MKYTPVIAVLSAVLLAGCSAAAGSKPTGPLSATWDAKLQAVLNTSPAVGCGPNPESADCIAYIGRIMADASELRNEITAEGLASRYTSSMDALDLMVTKWAYLQTNCLKTPLDPLTKLYCDKDAGNIEVEASEVGDTSEGLPSRLQQDEQAASNPTKTTDSGAQPSPSATTSPVASPTIPFVPTLTGDGPPAQQLRAADMAAGHPGDAPAYDTAFATLSHDCTEQGTPLANEVHAILGELQSNNINDQTNLTIMQHMAALVPAGSPKQSCASIGALYLAHRETGF
ncbi:hypothetical protein [Streptacidiphilus sp. EB129]|uniref:hypothetical protein n=1 Tax=Streptacidiphilus sp. EB129 TaxID=3156262 RepID=UPI003515FA65